MDIYRAEKRSLSQSPWYSVLTLKTINFQMRQIYMQSTKSRAGAKKSEVLKGCEEVVKISENSRASVGKGCLKLAQCNTHKRPGL